MLLDILSKESALTFSQTKFQCSWLTLSGTPGKSSGAYLSKLESLDITPWGTTVDFVKVGGIRELIAEGHENHTVMDPNTQRLECSEFLSSARSSGRNEGSKHFPYEGSFPPKTTS